MAGVKLKLGMPEVAARVDTRHAREPDGWRKTRLLAVKLAARGASTSAEIAERCGIARGHLFVWLRVVRERGLDALLARGKPGPQEGMGRGVKAKVMEGLRAKLEANEFATAGQARRWLKSKHRVERPYLTVWRWLKKFGGVLRVPRRLPARVRIICPPRCPPSPGRTPDSPAPPDARPGSGATR